MRYATILHSPLILLTIGWIIGLLLGRWFVPPWIFIIPPLIPLVSAIILYHNNPKFRIGAGIGLASVLGASRILFTLPSFDEADVAFYNEMDTPVEVTGTVIAEPDVRDFHINLHLATETITTQGEIHLATGLVLVRAPRYPQYQYGDRLVVRGKLETPPIFEDFSYKDYLAQFGIHSMIRRPKIELVERDQGNPFWTLMLIFKREAAHTINAILSEPYASLLNGILLGIETGIPRDLYEQFNLTGTSHIIVISGSNISLIAGILLLLGQRVLGRRLAPPIAIIGIVIYTFLVGADAAVSRAAVMGGTWVLAV